MVTLSSAAADRHPLQLAYFLARAAYEVALEELGRRCRAEGIDTRDDDAAFDREEEICGELKTRQLFQAQQSAEDAVIRWSVEKSRALATPAQSKMLDELLELSPRHPSIRAKMLDAALRLRA